MSTFDTATIKGLTDAIEAARLAGVLSNDAARAASVALTLTGDDAMLAVRVLVQGSDPASLEYVTTGDVSAPIRQAHRQGPGGLAEGEDRDRWLYLAALSCDESKPTTLRERVAQFCQAVIDVNDYLPMKRRAIIGAKESEIKCLPFTTGKVGGREMRVYATDLGFAAAYWEGEACAAVRCHEADGSSYLAVGANAPATLEGLGVKVDKTLAPAFGLIFEKGV